MEKIEPIIVPDPGLLTRRASRVGVGFYSMHTLASTLEYSSTLASTLVVCILARVCIIIIRVYYMHILCTVATLE